MTAIVDFAALDATLIQTSAMIDDSPFVPFMCSLLIPIVICLWLGLRLRHRCQLLYDLPSSKLRGTFLGDVEPRGAAKSKSSFSSYLARAACILFGWHVDERRSRTVTKTTTDSKVDTTTTTRTESGWSTVAKGCERAPFYSQNDTGAFPLRLDGAKIEPRTLFSEKVFRSGPLYYGKTPDTCVSDSDHIRPFVETGIPLHAQLFTEESSRERADLVAPEIAAQRDPALIRISTRSQVKIRSSLGGWFWFWLILGLLIAGGPLFFILYSASDCRLLSSDLYGVAAIPACYLIAAAANWVWMVYNSPVSLRQRVRQNLPLIDVQLKRHHDFLPTLVTTIAALSDRERDVQAALAAQRTQTTATPRGATGADFEGVADQPRLVIERYPQLTSQPTFASLHNELVKREQRVALVRTYFNNIASHYAKRLKIDPDQWVARLGAMTPKLWLAAARFERVTVPVSFAK